MDAPVAPRGVLARESDREPPDLGVAFIASREDSSEAGGDETGESRKEAHRPGTVPCRPTQPEGHTHRAPAGIAKDRLA